MEQVVFWAIWAALALFMGYFYLHHAHGIRSFLRGTGTGLVALLLLRIVTSKREVYAGVRNMIFRGDYSYFSTGDVLCKILPETFARNMALLYLGIVAAEIFVFVMIRVGIRLAGRPHRY